MTVGERIRTARVQRGMTQKQVGERAGIAEPTIRKYELGKLNPKYETLQKIASALNVSTTYLQGYEDSIESHRISGALKNRDAKAIKDILGIEIEFISEEEERKLLSSVKTESGTPDDAASDVETDDLAIFDRVCQLTGYYTRPKLDDLSGYYLGKHGEESEEVFLSNKEFRALIKRVAATTAAVIDSEIEVAKDDNPPK